MKKAIVIYMPVIHQGYIELMKRHPSAEIVLLSSESVKAINEKVADQLSRDLRCVEVLIVKQILESIFGKKTALFRGIEQLKKYDQIVMPNEDISQLIADKVRKWTVIHFDDAFLRWDWSKTVAFADVVGQYPATINEFDRLAMNMASGQAGKSSDFWRQVGAVIPKDSNSVLCAGYNEHMPSPMSPYVEGDPRLHMKPGENPEICGAIHGEANLIAQAAKDGISLGGKNLYVTTFPCQVCARLIVKAGIAKVFFQKGYSQLDAAEILRKANIEVFQVQ